MAAFILTLNAWLMVASLSTLAGVPVQTPQAPAAAAAAGQDQVMDAITAIAQAGSYGDLIAELNKDKALLASPAARALVDQRITEAGSNKEPRRLLLIMKQLFADVTKEGAETAADRYLVRLIAASAMTTADTDRLQRLLTRYYEFSPKMNAALIDTSLKTMPLDWPKDTPLFMTNFVEDWHTVGAREAGRELTASMDEVEHDPTGAIAKTRDLAIVGQWYFTHHGMAGENEDINLVLTKHGTARTYAQTAGPEDFEGITAGRWTTVNGVLTITWEAGDENPTPQVSSAHYDLSGGDLVWPVLGTKSWQRR